MTLQLVAKLLLSPMIVLLHMISFSSPLIIFFEKLLVFAIIYEVSPSVAMIVRIVVLHLICFNSPLIILFEKILFRPILVDIHMIIFRNILICFYDYTAVFKEHNFSG